MEADKPNVSLSVEESQQESDLYNSDSVRLKIFVHDDIWKLVADKLQNVSSDDLENLANSSPFFQKLLALKRTTFLFTKVLDLVASTVWNKEGLEGFPVAVVLKCRGVCPHWNFAVDKLIPDKFQHFGKGTTDNQFASGIRNAFESVLENDFRNFNVLNLENSTQTFLRHFERTHLNNERNPFIWRSLSVSITFPSDNQAVDVYENYQSVLEGISSILSKYGSHLHKFYVGIDGNDCFKDASKFQQWLLRMPNLKDLTFHREITGLDDEISSLEQFDKFQEDYPLPKLGKLQVLTMNGLGKPWFEQLIRQNSQITKLDIGYWNFNGSFFTDDLPTLKTLIMENTADDMIQKLRYPQYQWPITSLTIKLFDNLCTCADLFNGIQDNFASTLLSLDLKMSNFPAEEECTVWENCGICELDLPKLKNIFFQLKNKRASLDFLLPMKNNLEKISLDVGYQVPLKELTKLTSGTIVQFVGFELKLLKSNIWAIFKNLKTVELNLRLDKNGGTQKFCYARKEWMENNLYT